MDGKIEQHTCIKFCMKLSNSATRTHYVVCETFGQRPISQTAVFERHARFRADLVSVKDDRCSRLPSTSKMIENIGEILGLIYEDHRQIIREIADTVGISYVVCQEILTESLNVRPIAAKFVPPVLDK
jgi:hypothetical protein